MNSDFLLGLVAGEGSFSIPITKNNNKNSGFDVRTMFALKMRSLDENMVEEVKSELGVGYITSRDSNKANEGKTIQYRVSSQEECRQVIHYLDQNMNEDFKMSDKYQSYLQFKKAVKYLENRSKSSPQSIIKLAEIRENMNDDTRFKRDHTFFNKKFGCVTKVSEF